MRIVFQGEKATVKYEGPLKHEDKGDEIWLGVEWDDKSRGRHNGTVQGYTYFVTSDGSNSGSLLRKSKVSLGHKMIDSLFLKYFKEIPPELIEQQEAQEQNEHMLQQQVGNQLPQETFEIILINQKKVTIEFDQAAFFETIKKKKKMVEFYGFDEIYKKITNLQTIKELSLEAQFVASLGPCGMVGSIFQNLRNLSLENNLLYSWHQVFLLGQQLKQLRELSVSGNILQPLTNENKIVTLDPEYKIFDNESKLYVDQPVLDSCNHIEVLVLINMKISWKDVSQLLPAFRGLEQLLICRNNLTDYENLEYTQNELRNLKLLNLENTQQNNISIIEQKFGDLPKIERLILNRNEFSELQKLTKFVHLKHLQIDHNKLIDPICFSQISQSPLETLSIKHNLIQEKFGKLYVRQRGIAELGHLTVINGSQISKFERKDSEIFYLKSAFEEYFILKQAKHYYYDYEDFMKYAEVKHPRIDYLVKKYGNPYEIDPTVKGQYQQKPKQAQAQYCTVKIIDRVGKLKDKPTDKKFMSNTGIFPVKQVVAKLSNIPLKSVQVSIQVDNESEIVLMDGKDMTLADYGAIDGSLIFVDQIQ